MDVLWRAELFGGLKLICQDRTVTRFKTYKTGAVLAYLCQNNQLIPRETLMEMFWPDAELDAARNSLRVALTSLRRQLEPPGVPAGKVLIADHIQVQINRQALMTDVAQFEAGLEQVEHLADDRAQIDGLLTTVSIYQGPLLPGCYEDWVTPERIRLADAYAGALRRLTRLLVQVRELDRALDVARRALVADPLHETSHRHLIQLYVALGKPAAAVQQYRELEALLKEQLGGEPSAATRELVKKLALDLDRPVRSALPSTTHPVPERSESRAPNPVADPSPVARPQGYLPPQLTRFFGRDAELDRLQRELQAEHRCLITLTGPGGIGKTRLAIQTAERLRAAFQNRVWFVGLAETTDRDGVIGAIASALQLQRAPEVEPLPQVLRALTTAPALLVLDNMEQVVEAGSEVVSTLLVQAPGVAVIVTSRQALGIAGERVMPVSLLAAPPQAPEVEALLATPAVQLFLDRAQAVSPDFQITPRNAEAVAQLCNRLEGLPLAIELAAAWAQTLTPAQMLERLIARFDLLVSARRDRSPRHRTLRAAIDWSFHLMEPALQAFMARLSVFQGGWTLDAAHTVCQEPHALGYLHELRQRSLVTSEEADGQIRFGMLTSIREYAASLLPTDERGRLSDIHARYYRQMVISSAHAIQQTAAANVLRSWETENANFNEALQRFAHCEAWIEAAQMTAGLWRFWYETAQIERGNAWMERICACAPALPAPLEAELFYGAGRLAACRNDVMRAEACFERSLKGARTAAGVENEVRALAGLVLTAGGRGDTAAVASLLAAGLQLKRQGIGRWRLAWTLNALAEAHLTQGDCAASASMFTEAVALRRTLGDYWGMAEAQMGLSQAIRQQGHHHHADELEAEATAGIERLGAEYGLNTTFLNLGTVAWEQGDYAAAHDLFREALTFFQERDDRAGAGLVLECLAKIALGRGEPDAARIYSAQCLQMRRESQDHSATIVALQLAAEAALAGGDQLTADTCVREALRLCVRYGDAVISARVEKDLAKLKSLPRTN
jgi:predicted ATPase/DNA-binding SARP family transcriptional activator